MYEQYGYGDFIRSVMASDITEIPGADNLHDPSGVLQRMKENYAGLYGVDQTELLINGGSAGLIASILAAVPKGGRILMGRNTHLSAYTAIRFKDLTPVYVLPGPDGRISAAAVEDVLKSEEAASDGRPPVSAVLITSPDYYGVMSDVAAVAKAVHRHGIPLIVDQAHGAHLAFFDAFLGTERSAERSGADLVVNSTHKTLLSFTGTGILNICSGRVRAEDVSGYLNLIQTTSPSYLLLGSLDVNERILRRASRDIVERWTEDLYFFRERVSFCEEVSLAAGENIDPTKLYVSVRPGGNGSPDAGGLQEGSLPEEELIRRNIWPEMHDRSGALLMTGAGSIRSDYEALAVALENIVCEKTIRKKPPEEDGALPVPEGLPEYVSVPERWEKIPLFEAEGRVVAEAVTPYPPGVPLICPGEKVSLEMMTYLGRCVALGDTVMGVDEEGRIKVGASE